MLRSLCLIAALYAVALVAVVAPATTSAMASAPVQQLADDFGVAATDEEDFSANELDVDGDFDDDDADDAPLRHATTQFFRRRRRRRRGPCGKESNVMNLKVAERVEGKYVPLNAAAVSGYVYVRAIRGPKSFAGCPNAAQLQAAQRALAQKAEAAAAARRAAMLARAGGPRVLLETATADDVELDDIDVVDDVDEDEDAPEAAAAGARALLGRRRRRAKPVPPVMQFWLDRPVAGAPDRSDSVAPYSFGAAVGRRGQWKNAAQMPFDTMKLNEGAHTLHVRLVKRVGSGVQVVAAGVARFTVNNADPTNTIGSGHLDAQGNPIDKNLSKRPCAVRFRGQAQTQRCGNGRTVKREMKLNCQFGSCTAPTGGGGGDGKKQCRAELYLCPLGKYVRRQTSLNCRFAPCPTSPPSSSCSAAQLKQTRRCPVETKASENAHFAAPSSFVTLVPDPYDGCRAPSCASARHGVKNVAATSEPKEPATCPSDLQHCSNGQTMPRLPKLNCAFDDCPEGSEVVRPNPCAAEFPDDLVKACPQGHRVKREPARQCQYPPCTSLAAATGDDAGAEALRAEVLAASRRPSSCGGDDGSCTAAGPCPSGSACCDGRCYEVDKDDSEFPVALVVGIAVAVLFVVLLLVLFCHRSGSARSAATQRGGTGGLAPYLMQQGQQYHHNPMTF